VLPSIYALVFRRSLGRQSAAKAPSRDMGFGPVLPSPAE
jgi:hypothetical protein